MPRGDSETRAPLSRDRIVAAAMTYIDQHGAQQLTMRKLGGALDVEAMALYRHVSGREALLEAVVREVLRDVTEELDGELVDTWQGYLQGLAHRIREIALEHPNIFPLVATRHPAAPWIRPPLRDLDVVEHFLASLIGFGFSGKQAVHAYQSFSSFLLGHLLLEVLYAGAETSPVEMPLDEGKADLKTTDEQEDLSEFPTITELSEQLQTDASEDQFEIGLESLIDRLELSLTQ